MEVFDLEKALGGAPVMLKNGEKAYIKTIVDNAWHQQSIKGFTKCLVGYIVRNTNYIMCWDETGKAYHESIDIIAMWQEPRPRVQLVLPAPLETVEKGQEVYYLELGNQFSQISSFNFNEDNPCAFQLYKNGGLFATKDDAQEWLDVMRNARR